MIVLGSDVGKTTGLVLLDCWAPKPRLIEKCAVDDDLTGVLDARFFGKWTIDTIGVETPSQVFAHGRAKGDMGARIGIERALLVAREQAGVVKAVAALRAPAAIIHEAQAHEIRRAVLGKVPKTGIDRFIAEMIPHLIDGWPVRSNDHERDAAVAALYAWRRSQVPALRPIAAARPRRSA
jgi:hypothetical protein